MSDHSDLDHDNSENNKKSFGAKFVLPLLIVACVFFLFYMLTKKSTDDTHAEPHGQEHSIESDNGHIEADSDHHEHDHGHEHDH